MNICLDLYLTYAKIGAMTFGGGYAMLPILKREVVDRKRWISEDELIDCYAIGQSTPGVIAVNAATLVGYRKRGVWGSVCATSGVVTPPLVIIASIASVLEKFSESAYVKHALAGMSAAICAVIALTVAGLIKKTWKDPWRIAIGAVVVVVTLAFGLPTVFAVLGAAVTGIVITSAQRHKAKNETEDKAGKEAEDKGRDKTRTQTVPDASHTEDTQTDNTQPKDTPSEDTQTEDTPSKDTHTEDTRAEDTQADTKPETKTSKLPRPKNRNKRGKREGR